MSFVAFVILQWINDKVVSLRGIEDRLKTCIDYIDSCSPTNPPNAEIMNELQGIVNILPNLHVSFDSLTDL